MPRRKQQTAKAEVMPDNNSPDRDSTERSFTYEDFDSGAVFDYLYSIDDVYKRGMAERRMAARASEVKFRSFAKLFRLYCQQHDAQKQNTVPVRADRSVAEFSELDLQLQTGDWHCDDFGIYKYIDGGRNTVTACTHMIAPIKRMRSVDTKAIRYKLAFNRSGKTDYVEIDAQDMASPNDIVKKLSPYGVSVTGGDRAKALVDFLRDIIDLNYDEIPEIKSISRLGWNEVGFSPYVESIEFGGATAFAPAYNAIREAGTFDKWMEEALDARSYSITARIVMAASFAAPLVEVLGVLPFFVHLWSSESGTGKTVVLMLAASVWANPAPGGPFVPTFRSTSVGMEMLAGFLHSLPVCIDELQLAKDARGKVIFNVYELASGSGKLRSNKSLGLNYTPTWNTCFLTTGETPIVNANDGEGAMNRVLEIECQANQSIIRDGHRTAGTLRDNYGHAGRIFIQKLQEEGQKERAKQLYDAFYDECMKFNTTGKQAMAAACVLTADALATEWIFHDGKALTSDELSAFMSQVDAISVTNRGYDTICDWVYVNANKMRGIRDDDKGECYGLIDNGVAKIIRSVFSRICIENGLSEKALLSRFRAENLIECDGNRTSKNARLGPDLVTKCVWLRLNKGENTPEKGENNPEKGTKNGEKGTKKEEKTVHKVPDIPSAVESDDELPF